ncbi:MAG: PAQR family membrane homeostasis protein TrhA [Fimbriimonas sp.]
MAQRIREPFNAVSHLVGAILAVAGFTYLLFVARTDPRALTGFAIYGALTTLLFGASAAYHWSHRGSEWLQRLDHAAIYLMIAGTYTPVCLLGLQGMPGAVVLGLQWTLAAIGVIATFTMTKPPTWLRLVLYLVMGWMILPLVGILANVAPGAGLTWMIAGGFAYTFGTVIYASKRPNPWPGRFGSHEIWHLFVLAGGICHYALMVCLAKLV